MSAILILPVGYYQGNEDSSKVHLGLAGGTGQYATVLRSCGEVTSKETMTYKDVAAGVEYRPDFNEPIVFGLRAGHLSTQTQYNVHSGSRLDNGYINPYFSIEGKYVGFGAGWLRNIGPVLDESLLDLNTDFRKSTDVPSGHLRLGKRSGTYFIVSFFEGMPIVSEYGYLMTGVGYGGSSKWDFVGGLSAGFYDGAGIFMSLNRKTSQHGWPGIAVRLGSSEGEFEGGMSFHWFFQLNRKN
ncbi:MAG: hypothetical protein GY841_21010 [FCB group bacterium]|nr:hypothetical protein [FCB group bacterium]